jgi:hypothetical protein
MGGFSGVPLDPLPQVQGPTAQDAQANPAKLRQGQAEQPPEQPPLSGWTGKGGQGLNIVNNFLSGWMAGKYMSEQKKQKAAIDEVGHYQTDYQNAMMVYQNMVNNPDAKPEEKEAARQTVLKNWKELHATQMKYLIPGSGDGAPQKGGAKNRLKSALGSEDPHLFAAGAIKLADQIDPTKAISADPKRQEEEFKFKQEQKDAAKADRYSELLKKGPNRTPEEEQEYQGLETEIHGPGAVDKAKVATMQRQQMEQDQHDLQVARDKFKQGGRAALNEREATILENAGELQKTKEVTTPFEAYAQDVGPGKRFATMSQAADAWTKKEIQMRIAERPLRQPSMWEELGKFGKASLDEQHAKDDADPTKPHKYRITIGGKTEERELTDEQVAAAQKRDQGLKATKIPSVTTSGEIADWVTERAKPTPQQKQDPKDESKAEEEARKKREKEEAEAKKPLTPSAASQLLSPIVADVVSDHPEWKVFTQERPIPGGISMAINPYTGGQGSILPWKKSEKELQKDYKDFQKAVGDELIRNGQGHRIKELLPGYFGGSTTPEQEYAPEPMEAPPA